MKCLKNYLSKRTDFKIVTVGGGTDGTVDHPLFVDARDQLKRTTTKTFNGQCSMFCWN
jgi:hypothetical protein